MVCPTCGPLPRERYHLTTSTGQEPPTTSPPPPPGQLAGGGHLATTANTRLCRLVMANAFASMSALGGGVQELSRILNRTKRNYIEDFPTLNLSLNKNQAFRPSPGSGVKTHKKDTEAHTVLGPGADGGRQREHYGERDADWSARESAAVDRGSMWGMEGSMWRHCAVWETGLCALCTVT